MDILIDRNNQDINIQVLDKMVNNFNNGDNDASQLLREFSEDPISTMYVIKILKSSQHYETKSYALTILLNAIKVRWQIFKPDERLNIRNFVIKLLLELLKDSNGPRGDVSLVRLVNRIIIEIAKREWPNNWPDFVPELISACKMDQTVCANNMQILKMLSEEVNENAEKLSSRQKRQMKPVLEKNFSEIFHLCIVMLNSSENSELLKHTLDTLSCYITWLPKNYIFESPLIKLLIFKFLPCNELKNSVLQCLYVVAAIDVKNDFPEYFEVVRNCFREVIEKLKDIVAVDFDLNHSYFEGSNEFRNYILFLANFIVAIFKNYVEIFDKNEDIRKQIFIGHLILLKISTVEDTEIFKICLEYWNFLTNSLNEQRRRNESPITLGRLHPIDEEKMKRYAPIVTRLREILVNRMERPKEVLIVEDEHGNVVKEEIKESYNKEMYNLMKSCLVGCTELDILETKNLMFGLLSNHANLERINVMRLNTLAWAVGSISGTMDAETEKIFLVHVIKELLRLCDQKRGKDQKAIIASCIMYVVGQYPRFLRMHWKFLKTVVNKLFEFMHETFPGVKEMAVETFMTIAEYCSREFVTPQAEQYYQTPYAYDILMNLDSITADLDFEQMGLFYEAMGRIISSETDCDMRSQLTKRLMNTSNTLWANLMQEASSNPATLVSREPCAKLLRIVKLNISVASGMKHAYEHQLGLLYEQLMLLYRFHAKFISDEISAKGVATLNDCDNKRIVVIKSEILRLFGIYIRSIKETNADHIFTKFVPALYTPLLGLYVNLHPAARDHNILSLLEVLIEKTGKKANKLIPDILYSVIKNTLDMISKNYDDFPDHRIKFYSLLNVVFMNCFDVLSTLNNNDFDIVIRAVFWGVQHENNSISRIALDIIEILIEKLKFSDIFNNFYKANLLTIMTRLVSILGDMMHKSDFDKQTLILAKLFSIVQSGDITEPLYNPGDKYSSNRAFVYQQITAFVSENFKDRLLTNETIEFVDGLFANSGDINVFRQTVNDFLLAIKEQKGH